MKLVELNVRLEPNSPYYDGRKIRVEVRSNEKQLVAESQTIPENDFASSFEFVWDDLKRRILKEMGKQ